MNFSKTLSDGRFCVEREPFKGQTIIRVLANKDKKDKDKMRDQVKGFCLQ